MSRRHRGPIAGIVVAALVAAGCTLPAVVPRTEADGATTGSVAWRPCPEVPKELVGRGARDMRYDCASIPVPKDWDATGADTFEIALIRIRSTEQRDRIGSLLINPGGPGGSGIDTAVYLSFGEAFGGLPEAVTNRFDIVGFDPRGVARSSPVKCISDDDLDAMFGFEPDPVDRDEFDELVTLNRKIAEGCAAKYGDELRLYSTRQAARDMDAIRAAVGDEKLTYLGYSYGTLLGATYARLFPGNVRALVLDGAVDPRQDTVAGSQSQARGFERAFTNFTDWCRQNAADCPIAPDARAAVTDAMAKARVSPVQGADGRKATPGWILYAVVSSLYTETGWTQLAEAIDDLAAGDAAGMFALADAYTDRDETGRYSNLFDANLAVNCADSERRPSLAEIRRLQEQWRQRYPMFGAPLATGLVTCAVWPAPSDPYPIGAADGAPPILVVGTTGDPATPYENTQKLADLLGVGRVLTWEGEGHTAYPQTRCVTDAVNDYLIDLRLPRDGLRCPPR
ncbi:MAG TPA: alpha/beta hydrolase [Micromonosporaceae bacterium]